MKTLATFALVTAAIATFASVAQAGDPTPQWQTELQRQKQMERTFDSKTTVALYSNRGIGRRTTTNSRPMESRFESRQNAHGQTVGAYVPDRE